MVSRTVSPEEVEQPPIDAVAAAAEAESEAEARVVSSPSQRRALAAFAFAAVAALVWLSLPIASGLFLGTLLAFSLLGVHGRLSRRFGRPALVAVLLAVASALGTVGGLVVLFYFVIARGIIAAGALAREFEPEGSFRKLLARLEEGTRTSAFGPIDVSGRIRSAARTRSRIDTSPVPSAEVARASSRTT